MAGILEGDDGVQARCLREKRARKRRASGLLSEQSVLRRVLTVTSADSSGAGEVADGAILIDFLYMIVYGAFGNDVSISEKQKKAVVKNESVTICKCQLWHMAHAKSPKTGPH